MDKIDLVREIRTKEKEVAILKRNNSLLDYLRLIPALNKEIAMLGIQLAKAVIDGTETQKPAKGERMPQTPEQFALMAEKYEKALLREKEENSRLRASLNKSKQKNQKARQEQREEDTEKAKKMAKDFYRWWWNQPGTNTEQGFDEWWREVLYENRQDLYI